MDGLISCCEVSAMIVPVFLGIGMAVSSAITAVQAAFIGAGVGASAAVLGNLLSGKKKKGKSLKEDYLDDEEDS
jgi:hypothetical protein